MSNPDTDTARNQDENEPVLVFEAATNEEAQVVRATLDASGIPAFLQFDTNNPIIGAVDDRLGGNWMNGVFVSASDAEAAREIISAPAPSDEALSAEADAAGPVDGV